MRTQSADISRVILVRMDSGEDVLESLRAAVTEKNIANGFILNGVGSLTSYNVHVVETVNLPPGNLVFSDNGPFDILSITGAVLGGRVHAHITFSGLAAIAEMPDADLTDWDQIRRRAWPLTINQPRDKLRALLRPRRGRGANADD